MRRTRRNGKKRVVAGVLLATMLASGAYALTAANTVAASKAGDGEGAVSGYSVSNIDYRLNTLDPSRADQLTYTLNAAPPAGSDLKVQLSNGGDFFNCTWLLLVATCNLTTLTSPTGQPVADITKVRVIAAD